jgi:hypothetical protein
MPSRKEENTKTHQITQRTNVFTIRVNHTCRLKAMEWLTFVMHASIAFCFCFLCIKRQHHPHDQIIIAKKPYGNDKFALEKML